MSYFYCKPKAKCFFCNAYAEKNAEKEFRVLLLRLFRAVKG